VLVIDARQRIVSCSPEAAALLHARPARLTRSPLTALPAALAKIIRAFAKNGRARADQEFKINTPGGRISLRANLLPLKMEAQTQVVVVLSQPPSKPAHEQNLRQLNRLANLGTVSASLAHEIKNSLVAIRTFVDLLLERNRDEELSEVVSREMQRINSIAGQMLRYAAPKPTAFAPVRIHELLDQSLRLLQHEAHAKMILLQRNYRATPDTVHGDDVLLQQAFMNLLLNALEATGPNGVLRVSTELLGGNRMQIQIQDSGPGIAEEHLSRLFEPFFTTKKHGTGLGLAISKRIAHEHRGAIEARSEFTKGSTFTISLPVSESP
jgi:signal transduction histidine kinase